MPEEILSTPSQNLRLKVLVPMSIGMLIFLGVYAASTSWYLDREIQRDLRRDIATLDTMFNKLLEQRAALMRAQLIQIAGNQQLQQLMLAKDRPGLLGAALPVFEILLNELNISHFYFHSPDRSVFLRVHKPSRYGDLISRHTLLQAVQSGKVFQGIELGIFGTFTQRVVFPWRHNGTLIGYLELGQDIEKLVDSFQLDELAEMFFLINKTLLTKEQVETGAKLLGKTVDWELLKEQVVVEATNPEMLETLKATLEQPHKRSAENLSFEFADHDYLGLSLPLYDSSRRQVGEFLVLRNVSEQLADYHSAMKFFILLCLVMGGGFIWFSAAVLGNTERQLDSTRGKLLDEMQKVSRSNQQLATEIDEREAADAALKRAHDELEVRVQERTEQLWLSLEQTRQARKQLSGVLSSVADSLLVTGLDGTLQLINASAEDLFNCRAEECIGKPLKSIIKDPALLKRMDEALDQQLPDIRIQFSQMSSDLQTPLFLQARTSVIFGKHGETAGMIFLIQDISHEREMERLKSEFISTAVHELSTPLTAIVGYTELMLSDQDFDPLENREFLSIVHEKAVFLSGLVGEMLDISRIESGKPLDLHKDACTAEELFERPIHHFRHLSKEHRFQVEISEPQMKFAADKEKIWQVMENLCSNAVKYSPQGGVIEVTGRPYENGYQVTVTDHGIGMTKEQSIKVFEKFYRCNQSDTSVGGTGLGMTIVKSIIDAHEGQVWIDSELGQYTKVHFIIPQS